MSRVMTFVIGFLLVAAGLGLVIKNWEVLAAMVKAFAGVLLALIGLVLMFAAGFKR